MLFIPTTALIGGSVTFALLWSYGAFLALVGALFGGSFLALLAGLLLAFLERKQEHSIQASSVLSLTSDSEIRSDVRSCSDGQDRTH
jgi:hypothetical protein